MSASDSISQRDLRMRSKEIMDAVERGESFVVTRDGRAFAELTPLRAPQRFISRADFVRGTAALPRTTLAVAHRMLADIDEAGADDGGDPFAR